MLPFWVQILGDFFFCLGFFLSKTNKTELKKMRLNLDKKRELGKN